MSTSVTLAVSMLVLWGIAAPAGSRVCASPEVMKKFDECCLGDEHADRRAHGIALRRLLADPRNNLHHTALGQMALHEIGAEFEALSLYDRAAERLGKVKCETGRPAGRKARRGGLC